MTGVVFILGFVVGALFLALVVCVVLLVDSLRVHRLSTQNYDPHSGAKVSPDSGQKHHRRRAD